MWNQGAPCCLELCTQFMDLGAALSLQAAALRCLCEHAWRGDVDVNDLVRKGEGLTKVSGEQIR